VLCCLYGDSIGELSKRHWQRCCPALVSRNSMLWSARQPAVGLATRVTLRRLQPAEQPTHGQVGLLCHCFQP
jgi:hypothetical protein